MSSSSSSSSGLTWLEDQIVSFPEAAPHYQQLSADYQKKLWHQISVKLHELTTLPFLAAPSVNQLLRLHDHFIIKFQNKLNPLDYATFVSVAAEQATDPLAFLTPLLPSVASDPQASLFLKNEITRRIMAQGKMDRWDECKDRIEEAKKTLDGYIGIMEPIVHSSYYRAALLYHKARGPASAYYSNSLLYLTYTPLESIPPAEQIQLASEVGLAALIGDSIYNFGELLQHPIVKTLQGTQHDWIAQMLEAFNSGNIAKFKTILAAKQATEPILPANRDFLNQKIRIMSLIELVFRRPSNERKLTFTEIATHCELKPDEVELLLMKSFSLKVLKGTIDQVDSYVRINWVQPRVLNMEQIASVRDRLQTWSKEVNETAQFLEENAKTIL